MTEPMKAILLVEDDPADSARFERIAGRAGASVSVCDSPGAALAALSAGLPDLVVIDLNINDDDGARLLQGGLKGCRDIRKKSLYGGPIVFLSGMRDRELLKYCFELGADDYVIKSESAAVLESRIRHWFDVERAAPNGLAVRRAELLRGVLVEIAQSRDSALTS